VRVVRVTEYMLADGVCVMEECMVAW
jgi:hypothetical protein